jgi:hypothetical protein
MGWIAIPEMVEYDHDKGLITATVAAANASPCSRP